MYIDLVAMAVPIVAIMEMNTRNRDIRKERENRLIMIIIMAWGY